MFGTHPVADIVQRGLSVTNDSRNETYGSSRHHDSQVINFVGLWPRLHGFAPVDATPGTTCPCTLARACQSVSVTVDSFGCGAWRNALPLVRLGWHVVGTDLSWPMLCAAASRTHEHGLDDRLHVVLAPMERIPARDRRFDLVIAHGIWNLARSAAQFRRALDEAARVAKPGAGLFVFTFSRNTLPAQIAPVAGESFVFTEFSGEPQCFSPRRNSTPSCVASALCGIPACPSAGTTCRSRGRFRPARRP